ncbi:unnamed protein product [Blepharisma stoltei]|uniref:Uncharacterized protein n=1 Tax=Blepharisma stoltei TaxID=1481888 RepID=A0AAU9JDK3_9CILI|nr:unnamed protein product [Blepharisma stoltei]
MAEVSSILANLRKLESSHDLNPRLLMQLLEQFNTAIQTEKSLKDLKIYFSSIFPSLINISMQIPEIDGLVCDLFRVFSQEGFDVSQIITQEILKATNEQVISKILNFIEVVLNSAPKDKQEILRNRFEHAFIKLQERAITSKLAKRIAELKASNHILASQKINFSDFHTEDKVRLIGDWLAQGPFLKTNDGEMVNVDGIIMAEFFSDQHNFQLLLDHIFKHENGATIAFKAYIDPQNSSIFHKYHQFDAVELTMHHIADFFSAHVEEVKVMMACKLIDFWIKKDENRTLALFFELEIGEHMITHIKFGAIQHFLHFVIITNHSILIQWRNRIVGELLPKFIQELLQLQAYHLSNITDEGIDVLTGIASFFEQLLSDALSVPVLSSVDEIRDAENKALFKEAEVLKSLLLVTNGTVLMQGLIEASLKEIDHPRWLEVKNEYLNILITVVKACKTDNFTHISIFLNPDVINCLQGEIMRFQLSTKNKIIQLNAFTIQIPINLYLLNLFRALANILELTPQNVCAIERECWNKLFTCLFVYKTNAILCSLMKKLSFYMFECKNEKNLRYILLSRGVLSKLVAAAIEPIATVEERDFRYLAKETLGVIVQYATENDNDLSEELKRHQSWHEIPKHLIRKSTKNERYSLRKRTVASTVGSQSEEIKQLMRSRTNRYV